MNLDTQQIDNEGGLYDGFRAQYRDVPVVVEASQGPIPIEQTLDPASPNDGTGFFIALIAE